MSLIRNFEPFDLLTFSKTVETPCYIYSEKRIRENIRNLKAAASPFFSDFRLQYAIKANSNPHILKIIAEEEIGADCSSPVEMKLAKRVGFDMKKSTYTGNFETSSDFKVALDTGCVLNLDDHRRLKDVLAFGTPEVLSVRINPGVGRGSHAGVVTGGKDGKFGIPHEETGTAYKACVDAGIKRLGIHMMTGSNNLDDSYFAEITELLFDIIKKHISPLNIPLEFINIGGGLGVPYKKGENELNIKSLFSSVSDVFKKRLPELNIGTPKLAMEPGRYVVADAGILLTKIHHIKKSYKNFVGVDGGMTTMVRPAMYQSYHPVTQLESKSGEAGEYWICGQICENTDVYPEARKLVNPQVGDVLAIENSGAYGHVMSSNYNHRPRPAEYLLKEDMSILKIRDADNEADLFLKYPDFKW
ncbi:MAG: diaminopimelate decarboxylase [Bdellovibrionales bacterium]|nr:diaminopimelate decarboxylase [Bdellovibrionales bacterium]